MNESDGESATEYTKLMTSFVNSQYSKTDSSLQATLANSSKERMPQSVSDPSMSGRTEMYSPVRNVWCLIIAQCSSLIPFSIIFSCIDLFFKKL